MDVPHSEGSLYQALARIPDPRHARGRVYPLAAILTFVATALLCGCRSLLAIAQWGQDYNELAPLLGLHRRKTKDPSRYRTPCVGELHTVLAALDTAAFEEILRRWILAQGVDNLEQLVLALDGKTLRGTQGHEVAGVHLLAAYCQARESVVAQLRVPGKTNEHKTALELLKLVPLEGTLITGDAAFIQRDLCTEVITRGGDYFLSVKENQPSLEADIRAAFSPAFSPSGTAQAADRG
jgi:hypothetical protein